MVPTISKYDLVLINTLSSRKYTGNRLLSNASENERIHLGEIKSKLKVIAEYFANRYRSDYGPFETSIASGNPIAIGGKSFNRVWSGIFKGAENKQYAAQVSIVMNAYEPCIDVGFYFGRASGHSVTYEQRIVLESQLNKLGLTLSETITQNKELREKYNLLFDFGFRAYSNGRDVLSDIWLDEIKEYTQSAQITAKIYTNDFDIIENSTIDSYVSQVICLMGAFGEVNDLEKRNYIKPITPEQRAKEAERLAFIGQIGELFAFNYEKERLINLGLYSELYPRHVALESMSYGYDILSLDENSNEIYIEVKTTTRVKEDPFSRRFHISINEYNKFINDQFKFKLYRVYDIEANPCLEIIDLNIVVKKPDGYIINY